jgi:methionyl aminopeptidase
MRVAGKITRQILLEMAERVKVGVTPIELDQFAERRCAELGVTPAFKGYQGFPNSVCISVNDQVVHTIPGPKPIAEGDVVKLDFGVIYQGFYGDSAITLGVGKITPEHYKLIEATKQALLAGIAQVKPGNRVGDISAAIESVVRLHGFSVVSALAGHGIGRHLHEDPPIPNAGTPGRGYELRPGLVIAIEPIVNEKEGAIKTEDDDWTTRSVDGGFSAHFEHTVAVTDEGCEILTIP